MSRCTCLYMSGAPECPIHGEEAMRRKRDRIANFLSGVVAGMLVGVTIAIIVFTCVFSGPMCRPCKTKAVKAGHATWALNSEGDVDFQWNDPCGKK